jgi:hypothetical protein
MSRLQAKGQCRKCVSVAKGSNSSSLCRRCRCRSFDRVVVGSSKCIGGTSTCMRKALQQQKRHLDLPTRMLKQSPSLKRPPFARCSYSTCIANRNPICRMSTSKLWQGSGSGREVSGPLGYLRLQGPYGVRASRENKDGEWTI